MKRFLVAPLIAAVAIFFLGFAYWGVPHNLPYKALNELPDEAAAASGLSQLFPSSGAYLIPNPMKGQEHMAQQMKRGPTAEVYITKEGMNGMDPGMMAVGFLHGWVVCLALMLVLTALGDALPTYGSRIRLCNGIGLLCFLGHMADAVWWHHPWGWTFAKAIYDLAVFVVAGLILAKFAAKPAVTGS